MNQIRGFGWSWPGSGADPRRKTWIRVGPNFDLLKFTQNFILFVQKSIQLTYYLDRYGWRWHWHVSQSGSNRQEEKKDPDPTVKKKLDPNPTLEKDSDPTGFKSSTLQWRIEISVHMQSYVMIEFYSGPSFMAIQSYIKFHSVMIFILLSISFFFS